jgi:hypothetical protein
MAIRRVPLLSTPATRRIGSLSRGDPINHA